MKLPATAKKKPLVMGVLNVTPDSFSDGGMYVDAEQAVTRGLRMVHEGASIVDIGGESSRPGSKGVGVEEEMERVLPVVEALVKQTDALISVDTVKPAVAKAALSLGAGMINDVSNLRDGTDMAELAAQSGAILVLMHSRGIPATMAAQVEYSDLMAEVKAELSASVKKAEALGVPAERIWLDPGIGFAKQADQSIALIARLQELVSLGFPVLVGPSRKSFIDSVVPSPTDRRIGGTAAAVVAAILNGATAVRVHDVEVMYQAAMVAHAVRLVDCASAAGGDRCV